MIGVHINTHTTSRLKGVIKFDSDLLAGMACLAALDQLAVRNLRLLGSGKHGFLLQLGFGLINEGCCDSDIEETEQASSSIFKFLKKILVAYEYCAIRSMRACKLVVQQHGGAYTVALSCQVRRVRGFLVVLEPPEAELTAQDVPRSTNQMDDVGVRRESLVMWLQLSQPLEADDLHEPSL